MLDKRLRTVQLCRARRNSTSPVLLYVAEALMLSSSDESALDVSEEDLLSFMYFQRRISYIYSYIELDKSSAATSARSWHSPSQGPVCLVRGSKTCMLATLTRSPNITNFEEPMVR